MKKMISAVAALGVLSSIAGAQSNFDFTPYNYSFRGGVAFASDSAFGGGDTTWINLGVDFDFNTSILRQGDSYLSFDVLFSEDLDDIFLFPIMLNNRFYLNEEDKRLYLNAGIGLIWGDLDGDNEGVFAGRLGLGYYIGENIFITGNYTFGSKFDNGASPSHTSINIGYRF